MTHISRYFKKDDQRIDNFSWNGTFFEFYNRGWWSRTYEYYWMSNLRNLLPNIKVSAIDVATGWVHPGMFILKNSGFDRVVGTDILDINKLVYNNLICDGIEYINDDIVNSKIDEKFNCVCCISVLEHINPKFQKQALTNLIKLVANPGILVMTFDMPGYDYKTDIELYNNIIIDSGMIFEHQDVLDNNKLVSSGCENAEEKIRKMNLSCYRIIARNYEFC